MSTLYFLMFDTQKGSQDISGHNFGSTNYNSDLAGLIPAFAFATGAAVENVRLFVFRNRKEWEKAREAWG